MNVWKDRQINEYLFSAGIEVRIVSLLFHIQNLRGCRDFLGQGFSKWYPGKTVSTSTPSGDLLEMQISDVSQDVLNQTLG